MKGVNFASTNVSVWWICESTFSKFKSENSQKLTFSFRFYVAQNFSIFCALAILDNTYVVLIDLNERTHDAFFRCQWHNAEYTYASY